MTAPLSRLAGVHAGMDDDGAIVVDVHGAGYRVVVHDRDQRALNANEVGSHVVLAIHEVTGEEGTVAYGFVSLDDRRAFGRILKVKGLGPSVALKLLSAFDATELGHVVGAGDIGRLTKLPGIGAAKAKAIVDGVKL